MKHGIAQSPKQLSPFQPSFTLRSRETVLANCLFTPRSPGIMSPIFLYDFTPISSVKPHIKLYFAAFLSLSYLVWLQTIQSFASDLI